MTSKVSAASVKFLDATLIETELRLLQVQLIYTYRDCSYYGDISITKDLAS